MTTTARNDVPAFCSADRDAQPSKGQPRAKRRLPTALIDDFLKSPFAGIAPWALLSILSGPGRFEIAVASALGFSVLVLLIGLSRGIKVHLLEVFGAVFFGATAIVGLFATDNVIRFLELWSGELTNISLAAFAWFTLLIRKPFTMAYAKDSTPQEHWDSPLFRRINDGVTAAWAGAFTFAAAAGFIGDFVFHDAGNFWTGWILQLAAIFFAVSFTEFYPDYATAKFDQANGEPAQVPSVARILDWLPTFVIVTGIAGFVTDAVDSGVGITLIVVGSVTSGMLAKLSPAAKQQSG